MQLTSNQRSKSRCMYCNQLSWGKGCRYAPHGVHFHVDIPSLCAYCGNPSYGVGCHVNPTGNIHIHGINYNNLYRENLQSFLHNRVFLHELKKDFTEFGCCKLGIIDANGNKLKQPVTEEEKAAYSPMIRTILKLKKYLGSKTELLVASEDLVNESLPIKDDIDQYKKVLEYKQQIENNVNELYKIFENAYKDGIPFEDIQKLIRA